MQRTIEDAGAVYRLIAGPIRNAAARRARLREAGIGCAMTLFAGERLSGLSAN